MEFISIFIKNVIITDENMQQYWNVNFVITKCPREIVAASLIFRGRPPNRPPAITQYFSEQNLLGCNDIVTKKTR